MKQIVLVASSLLLVFVLLVVLLTPQPARAGGIVGTGTAGSCTDAALTARLGGGGLVTFNCGGGVVTIVLTHTETLTRNTTLDGGNKIILSGGDATRIFYVSAGVSLSIKDLALSHGSSSQGGAIYNNGTLIVSNSALSDNHAPGGTGGTIYNTGLMTITNSALYDNAASAGLAGSIYNAGPAFIFTTTFSNNFGGITGGAIINAGNLIIKNSEFDYNQSYHGGAIDNYGTLMIGYSTFFSNTTTSGYGGGIYNDGSATIDHSNFFTNTAVSSGVGGAIYNNGSATITLSILLGNSAYSGGGIYNDLPSKLAVSASTLNTNLARGGLGGGIYNNGKLFALADTLSNNAAGGGLGGGLYDDMTGTVIITSSTFFGNFAGLAGGALVADGAVTLTNSTIYSNTNYGIVAGSAPVKLKNTIVAKNTVNNCFGTITSLGHNLEDTNTCSFTAGGDKPNISNPHIAPLANNGGSTPTDALLKGSAAINAGAGCPSTDQRGISRVGACDIGAYEFALTVYLPLILK
jgi:hypothetical protein